MTDKVNAFKYTRAPIAGGGLGDIYQGSLDVDTLVAIKCARPHTIEIDIDFMQVGTEASILIPALIQGPSSEYNTRDLHLVPMQTPQHP